MRSAAPIVFALALGAACAPGGRDREPATAVIAGAAVPARTAAPERPSAGAREDDVAAGASCEPQMFDHAPGNHGLFAFEDAASGRMGFRDKSGRIVIAPRFRHAYEFSPEGVVAVIDDAGPAFVDTRGRVIARALLEDNGPDYFVGGFARIVESGKVGFIDAGGRVVVRPRFDSAAPFCEGLAVVCEGCWRRPVGEYSIYEGGRWGYVDTKGKVAIPLDYDAAESFEGGRAEVVRDGRALRIDRRGRVLADLGPAKRQP